MNRMSGNSGAVRFRDGADKYATYLDTREGRLRLDLSFANLREFLPQSSQPLLALDIGGGTGAMAVRLAQLGLEVRLLDTSLPMLDLAKHAVREAAVADRIELRHGDAAEFETLFPAGSFDVILCHNILEYVDDPFTVLRGVSRALRDQASIVSVLVRNQAGEVFKAAIRDRDLDAAEQNLGAACRRITVRRQGEAVRNREPASHVHGGFACGDCRTRCTGDLGLLAGNGFRR